MSDTPPLSSKETICPRCERKYVNEHGKCPHCDYVLKPAPGSPDVQVCPRCKRGTLDYLGRCSVCDVGNPSTSADTLLRDLRENGAYEGTRVVLAIFTVLGLAGGVALIAFGAFENYPNYFMIAWGVVSLLVAVLQNLFGNAFLDMVDASIRSFRR